MAIRYKAIIFDLDDTLRLSTPPFLDRLRMCLETAGVPVRTETWHGVERWIHWYWAQSPEIQEDVKRYGQDGVWTAFWQRLMGKVGYHGGQEEALHLSERFLTEYRPRSIPRPGAHEILFQLRWEGVTLGVLSNRSQPFDDELHALGLSAYFDFTLHALAVGTFKPDPRVFHAALERSGAVAPSEALYVGDNYYADVLGAQAAGMDAVLIDERGIYGDVECPVVRSLNDLMALLSR